MTALESLLDQMKKFRELQRVCMGMNGIKDFRFDGIEDLVLHHGYVFERASRKPPKTPIAKACFQQSYRLAMRSRKWIYCEGVALTSHGLGLAVNHAWVCRRDAPTIAHDLAWAEGDRSNTAYMGIPFTREFIREVHLASGRECFGVLDAFWMRHPLITGAIAIENVIWKGE